MEDDDVRLPSRQRFRDERRAIKRAERRRRMIAIPAVLAGVGAYSLALVSVIFTLISLILPHKWLRRDRTPTDEDHYLHPTGTTRPASLTATPDRCYHSALRRPHRGPHQPR